MMYYTLAGTNMKYKNIEELLKLADLDIESMKADVKSYMNANAMVWGWKQPEDSRDHIDLVVAVLQHSPHFKFEENHDFDHLLQVLRSERVASPITVVDWTPPTQRTRSKKGRKRSTSSSSTSSDHTPWVAPVYDSYDSGSGSYSD